MAQTPAQFSARCMKRLTSNFACGARGFEPLPCNGQDADKDDDQDDLGKIIFDQWNVSKQRARANKSNDPQERANNVVGKKSRVTHGAHTRNKWSEGSNNGHKARVNNCLASMLMKERLSFFQMRLF